MLVGGGVCSACGEGQVPLLVVGIVLPLWRSRVLWLSSLQSERSPSMLLEAADVGGKVVDVVVLARLDVEDDAVEVVP